MVQRSTVPSASLRVLAVLVAGLVAACGGRSDLQPEATTCSSPAITYCQSTDCPLSGPQASTATAVSAWCSAFPQIAPRVTAYGTCTTSNGVLWAQDVRVSSDGGDIYLLYDADAGALVSVSTLAGASADGGTLEEDYGTCANGLGTITCENIAYSCKR